MRRFRAWQVLVVLAACGLGWAGETGPRFSISDADVKAIYPDVEKVYVELHQTPELSGQEVRTAEKMAEALRKLGYEVTTGIGGNGVVGVLRNGTGPVVMLRTDMDALPVEERTGLPYASRVKARNPAGQEVSVMHACGHDLHMSAWLGTARLMAEGKSGWSGTLILIGQPAEELAGGAVPMLKDGLYTRFPKPDYVLAIHDQSGLPSGTVETNTGYVTANVDSVDITIYGRGSHGAKPELSVDPIVIAARTVLTLQTLISREKDPQQPAVLTVGSIHGGTKHNIIPDDVRMQLTVRAYKPEVRERLLRGIERIARAECEAGNTPKPPDVKVVDSTPVTVNDAALAGRVATALRKNLGEARVIEAIPIMGAEDFSRYAEPGVPILMIWVGAINPKTLERAIRDGTVLPGLHSSLFAPDPMPTIMTGVEALVTAARELFGTAKAH